MAAVRQDGIDTWATDADLSADVIALTVRLLDRVSVTAAAGATRSVVAKHVSRHLAEVQAGFWRCTTAGCERLA